MAARSPAAQLYRVPTSTNRCGGRQKAAWVDGSVLAAGLVELVLSYDQWS